mmetsp:Transcript_6813/g.8289  ORF Transcript_6813/g.8289 Transcript_6813/m.8289 type:complete len:177 (-) Transcript_6813:142-672(-)
MQKQFTISFDKNSQRIKHKFETDKKMAEVATIHTTKGNTDSALLQTLVDSIEKFSAETIDDFFQNFCAHNFHFRDPFLDSIESEEILNHWNQMFIKLDDVHFVVRNRAVNGQVAFIEATMSYIYHGKNVNLEFASRFMFNEKGKITEEIDFWDSYECMQAVPILGHLLKVTRKVMM